MPDGAACEIEQGPAFEAMLASAGRRPPLIVALQRHAAWALAALVLVIGLVFAGYRWGLPWSAERLAPHLPAQAVHSLGTRVLATLDRQTLKPSRLKAERLDALRARLELFAQATVLPAHQLLFRSAPALGVNAFALPGGTVVVLDRLVNVASDDQVVAVIAHELGHVAHHHAMRRLIQDAVVTTVTASYLGDFSTVAASATALALNAGYSREFELQADRYAAERLREAGRDPLELITLLEKISHRSGSGASALASHPDVAARADAIRRYVAAGAPASSPPAQP
jgi:Zn-dependent protease with chaperone function